MKNVSKLLVFGILILLMPLNNTASQSRGNNFIYKQADFDDTFAATGYIARSLDDVIASIPSGDHSAISGFCFSEVIFMGQKPDGRYLTFQTRNGNTSQEMQVRSAPQGLSRGQRVRIYYYMYSQRTTEYDRSWRLDQRWAVLAIERL